MMKYLGHDEDEQSKFTTRGIEAALNSKSYDDLEARVEKARGNKKKSQDDLEARVEKARGKNSQDSEEPEQQTQKKRRVKVIKNPDDDEITNESDDSPKEPIPETKKRNNYDAVLNQDPTQQDEKEEQINEEDNEYTLAATPVTKSQEPKKENNYDAINPAPTQKDEDEEQISDDVTEISAAVQKQGAAIAQQGNEVDGRTLGGLTLQTGALAAHIGATAAKELIESIESESDAKKLNNIIERLQEADERTEQLTDRAEQLQQTSDNIDDEDLDDLESDDKNQPKTKVVTSDREFTEEELTLDSDSDDSDDTTDNHETSDEISTENTDENTDNNQTSTPTEQLADAIDKTSLKLEKTGLLENDNDSEPTKIDRNASISEQLLQIEKSLERLEKRLDSLEERISALETAQETQTSSNMRDDIPDEQAPDELTFDEQQERQDKAETLTFMIKLKDSPNQTITDAQGRNVDFICFNNPETSLTEISGESEKGDIVFSAEIVPGQETSVYQNELSSDDLDTMIEQVENSLKESSESQKSDDSQKAAEEKQKETSKSKQSRKSQQMEL